MKLLIPSTRYYNKSNKDKWNTSFLGKKKQCVVFFFSLEFGRSFDDLLIYRQYGPSQLDEFDHHLIEKL